MATEAGLDVGQGGMALIKTHPDYMSFGPGDRRVDRYPVELYTDFLDYVLTRYRDDFWLAHPSEIASYWRSLEPRAEHANTIPAASTLCASCRDAHAAGLLREYPPASLVTNTPLNLAVSIR
jgi:hypothetical protein